MLRAKRPVLASFLAFSILFAGVVPVAYAYGPDSDRPGEVAMIADTFFARPVLAAFSLIGLGVFTLALPASILGDNVDESAEKLVRVPARSTFLRCVGCTPAQHDFLQNEKATEKANR